MGLSKVEVSEKGVKASGAIGRQKGSVGITETGIELAINVGVGKLGISTDYGGGVVVEFAGQKIVWGREGGYIKYSVLGLELLIEARDCVVVETRKIAGRIVDSHTYPDPGCKLPEPPKPPGGNPPPGSSLPPGVLSPADIDKAMSFSSCEHICVILHNHFETNWNDPYVTGTEGICFKPRQVKNSATGKLTNETVTSWESEFVNELWDDEIKNSLSAWDEDFKKFSIGSSLDYYTMPDDTRAKCFPETAPPSPPSPPSAGNRPPMPETCCELLSLSADIEDIKTVLATKEMLAKKLSFPWRTRIAGGTGTEIIEDYPNLLRALAQMVDHLGIHPPKLSVKDLNNAIAGDQGLENQFPSATQGFEALMSQIWDVNGDVDTLTNFLYRLSWLCVQQSMNLARLSGDIKAIKDMIGGECESTETTLTTPFNIAAGTEKTTKGEGFAKKGSKIDSRIDINTEKATEELLPDFLRVRDNDLVIERFSGTKDLFDLLLIIILKLERLTS